MLGLLKRGSLFIICSVAIIGLNSCNIFGAKKKKDLTLKDIIPGNTWYHIAPGDDSVYIKNTFSTTTAIKTAHYFPCDSESFEGPETYTFDIKNDEQISVGGETYKVLSFSEDKWTIRYPVGENTYTIVFRKGCEDL